MIRHRQITKASPRGFPQIFAFACVAIICLASASSAFAQFGGGSLDTGDFDIPSTGNQGGGQISGDQGNGNNGGAVTGGATGGATGGSTGESTQDQFGSEDADLLSGIDLEDVRNQGFVGPAAERIQSQGFVGPPGETLAPPLAEGATFGGGVNGGGSGGGGSGNQRSTASRGGQGFGQGNTKGFQVIRQSVRTRLVPEFASPATPPAEVGARFRSQIQRQRGIQSDGAQLQIVMDGRQATVQGFANTVAEKQRFIRQLRLQPGVDRIIDQVLVGVPVR